MTTSQDETPILNLGAKCYNFEDEEALGNSKALDVILNGVDKNTFRLINTCSKAKEAWEILETEYEGTSKVHMSRLQIFTTKFHNLIMKEDESISYFKICFCDIENTSFSL